MTQERRVSSAAGESWRKWQPLIVPAPNPIPETSWLDRDDDRLATELFRRYGSVEQGLYRGRDHWLADAEALRSIVRFDRFVDAIVQGTDTIVPTRDGPVIPRRAGRTPVLPRPHQARPMRKPYAGWDLEPPTDQRRAIVATAAAILVAIATVWLVIAAVIGSSSASSPGPQPTAATTSSHGPTAGASDPEASSSGASVAVLSPAPSRTEAPAVTVPVETFERVPPLPATDTEGSE